MIIRCLIIMFILVQVPYYYLIRCHTLFRIMICPLRFATSGSIIQYLELKSFEVESFYSYFQFIFISFYLFIYFIILLRVVFMAFHFCFSQFCYIFVLFVALGLVCSFFVYLVLFSFHFILFYFHFMAGSVSPLTGLFHATCLFCAILARPSYNICGYLIYYKCYVYFVYSFYFAIFFCYFMLV